MLGFDTSGGVTLADATASASLLGSYDNVALGLFGHTISLSTSTFESLLSGSSTIGLRFQGDTETVNTAVDSLRGSFPPQPTLVINYSTPEPASIISALLAIVCLGGYCGVRRTHADRSFA